MGTIASTGAIWTPRKGVIEGGLGVIADEILRRTKRSIPRGIDYRKLRRLYEKDGKPGFLGLEVIWFTVRIKPFKKWLVCNLTKAMRTKREEAVHEAIMERANENFNDELGLSLKEGFDDFETPVTGLGLTGRVTRPLIKAGITEAGGLIARSRSELLQIRGIGPTAVNAIESALEESGWGLKQDQ